MSDADYYAPGSYYDSSAPYNQSDIPEEEFEVVCSQSLSRTAIVRTDNYIPGSSGVDYESDDEGRCYAVPWYDEPDTSNTNWEEEYHDNDHYTPLQLIELFRKHLEDELSNGELPNNRINKYKHLIEECENWTEDEVTYDMI